MIPRDVAKTTITVYNYLDQLTPTYKRTVIKDCVWQQDSESAFRATGVLNAEAVKINIPFDYKYFSVQYGGLYKGDGWTIQMGTELVGTYIVKGECEFEFGEKPPIDLFKEFVQPFEKQYKYKRPKEVIEHFVGTKGLWYIEVRC